MNVAKVSAQDVMQRIAQGEPVMLVDVRTPVEYEAVHATSARCIPLNELSAEHLLEQCNGRAGDPVYVICGTGGRAVKAAQQLMQAGFEHVHVVEGGTQAWEAAGLPVYRGRQTMSLERQVRIASGSLVLVGLLLGWAVHPLLYLLAAFVGGGLVFAGVTDTCGMAMLLTRMPWNQRVTCGNARTCSA